MPRGAGPKALPTKGPAGTQPAEEPPRWDLTHGKYIQRLSAPIHTHPRPLGPGTEPGAGPGGGPKVGSATGGGGPGTAGMPVQGTALLDGAEDGPHHPCAPHCGAPAGC